MRYIRREKRTGNRKSEKRDRERDRKISRVLSEIARIRTCVHYTHPKILVINTIKNFFTFH